MTGAWTGCTWTRTVCLKTGVQLWEHHRDIIHILHLCFTLLRDPPWLGCFHLSLWCWLKEKGGHCPQWPAGMSQATQAEPMESGWKSHPHMVVLTWLNAGACVWALSPPSLRLFIPLTPVSASVSDEHAIWSGSTSVDILSTKPQTAALFVQRLSAPGHLLWLRPVYTCKRGTAINSVHR